MAVISLRLPDDLDSQLGREAEAAHRPKSEIARDAIVDYLRRQEKERFLAEIARVTRSKDGQQALEMAEEALPYDNEALELAEIRCGHEPRTQHSVKRRKRQ